MSTQSLLRREHPLASPAAQVERLRELGDRYDFARPLAEAGLWPLRAVGLDTLQINVGKLCNQSCAHCHVDAGPDRRETMSDEVLEACLSLLIDGGIRALDITGGAPELHPRFRELVTRAAGAGKHVMHRCNLTAILLPRYADIPELLAEHDVEIIASLPYYLPKQTDRQRGDGVFQKSIVALRRLNELGYGTGGSRQLNLVTNPVGAFLPGDQGALTRDWKRELDRRYGITFDNLFTITNMPISRYLEFLDDSGNLERYMEKLRGAFNPVAAQGVMCRSLISVGYEGAIYDCDFNQMLEMPAGTETGDAPNIAEASAAELVDVLARRTIRTAPHCFGCTAGAGSSCGGATA
jgi:radical SAM/Cys-rich protein